MSGQPDRRGSDGLYRFTARGMRTAEQAEPKVCRLPAGGESQVRTRLRKAGASPGSQKKPISGIMDDSGIVKPPVRERILPEIRLLYPGDRLRLSTLSVCSHTVFWRLTSRSTVNFPSIKKQARRHYASKYNYIQLLRPQSTSANLP